ncbi:FAD-binding oxidoreductase [Pseudonocardia sp. KRD291]|uniref:FAD-binding oxidoreductase n=1 Tax=Pseudonocardia sp. KRD291 TaxID=2792007 RepID=UPI001C4A68CE|nr:FAD-binding oxidoreductase [Pseudonocardia sp. KRD291]MBW0106277.1 FAD-binding oxidoreductase [Pseudonocardia sp. KRD291]
MTTFVPDTALAALVVAVEGPVLEPTDPGYAEEVSGFNAAYLPSPAVVVGATRPADVAAAVRHAAATGRRVSVQATGHGLLGDLNGTVLVSTRRMTGLSVDPAARTARVEAGVRWREVIDAAAPYGLAPLNGSASSVGVVGYTTGGGLGPMARRYGFAADHVTALTIVTADGEIRDVDAQCDPDLFWAVRGGKANFGIVTSIEFALMPVTRFHGGGIFFPGGSAPAVLHAWREWAPTLPEDATTSVALLALPPDPNLPPPLQGRFVAHLRFTHLGSAESGAALLAPMRSAAEPILDLVGEMPYPAIDAVHMDPTAPMPVWDRGTALAALPAGAVDAILDEAGPDSSSPLVLVELRLLGGAIARRPEVPNAVSGRDAAFSVYCLGVPAGPDAAVQVPARAASLVDALAPWTAGGGLVNLLGQASAGRVGALWSDDDRARLLEIGRRHDPSGMFGTNVVIG